jgi:hypothetical protein
MRRRLLVLTARSALGAIGLAMLLAAAMAAFVGVWRPASVHAQSAVGARPAIPLARFAVNAQAALPPTPLAPFFSATGRIRLSSDGLGRLDGAGGVIQVAKSPGATVRAAFLMAASTGFTGYQPVDGDVTIDGVPISWDPTRTIANGIQSVNVLADVTAVVRNKIDAAPAGRIDFLVAEPAVSSLIDGEVLAVILDDPNVLTDTTIDLLYGAQQVGGDTFAIGLSEPIDKSDPNLAIQFGLGISFSAQPGQFSRVDVNGQRLTTSAGGQDDLNGPVGNGALLTVGGLDDLPANPPDPFLSNCGPTCDDELYDLLPFVHDGDSAIQVFTQNPSNDDNIFFASLELRSVRAVVGEGITLAPSFARHLVGTPHTLTATVQDASGQPDAGVAVTFDVTQGPSAGVTGSVSTDGEGRAEFSYVGNTTGIDAIVARFRAASGQLVTSNAAIALWEPVRTVGEQCDGLDNDGDGRVDEGFPDTDRDGIADCVDADSDNDTVPNGIDNCPQVPNPDQQDLNGNGIGDACESRSPLLVNPPSPVEIEADGQFGPPADEWRAITAATFLNGDSVVYSAVEGQDIYLMYDYRQNSRPLDVGETVGPISFQIGGGSFFDVFVTQGGANTLFGPNPSESRGDEGDTVRVFLNGRLFDNGAGCVSGGVDYNSTSPNFAEAHTLVELRVRLSGFPGGCYSPEPAFWSATLPSVRATAATATHAPLASTEVETDNVIVSAAFFTVTATGNTEVSPLELAGGDTSPPVITVPSDLTAEAAGPSGAVVGYVASALDDIDGPVAVDCRPASGSTFPLGSTTVACTAGDKAGNVARATFTVRVRDTIAPALMLPPNRTVDALSPAGAAVTFSATAIDLVDKTLIPVCTPASGSTFAITAPGKSTRVVCTATDRSGNASTGSFTIHVNGAVEQIRHLDGMVASLPGHRLQELALRLKLAIALAGLLTGHPAIACDALRSFDNEVRAHANHLLTPAQAALLRNEVARIRAVVGCR